MSVQTAADTWRGVAAEEHEDVSTGLAGFLRKRSRVLLADVLRPHTRRIVAATVLVSLNTGCVVAAPYLVGRAIDRGITPLMDGTGSVRTLVMIVVAFVAVGLTDSLTYRFYMRIAGGTGERVLYDLRTRIFGHFQKLHVGFYERYTSGRVISRLSSDIDALSELFGTGLVILSTSLLSMIGISFMLLRLDPRLALVALGVFPFIFGLTVWFRRHSERAYRQSRTAIAMVIVHFTESLGGIRAVHAYRREQRNQEIFDDVNGRYRDANYRSTRLISVYGPGTSLLGDIAIVACLIVGGTRVLNQTMTLGVLTAFLLYLRQFFQPMMELSQFYNAFQAAASSLEKLSGVLEEEPKVPIALEPASEPARDGSVTFDRVTFAYREKPILSDLSLHVPSGQTLALVGATGAGKSTIARLTARFYDPSHGTVRIGGTDLRDLDYDQLRDAVGMVTQEGFLFSGTVADNIAFGRPDATRGDVERAATTVGAHEFIAQMPEGYDTDVRKRGGRLSAGQRQLVALARAFLADPLVLIFDEATSSVDLPSERRIQEALEVVLADRTAFIIAHRLSTVEIADRVLVIDGGKIVEDGSPAELMADATRWKALHDAWLASLA